MLRELIKIDAKTKTAVPSDALYVIPIFEKLLKRNSATRELAFIFFMENPSSPYRRSYIHDDERFTVLRNLMFSNRWVEPDDTKECRKWYRGLFENLLSLQILHSIEGALMKIKTYAETLDLTEVDKSGKPIHKPTELMKMTGDLAQTFDKLKKAKEKALQDAEGEVKLRGGVVKTKYNE